VAPVVSGTATVGQTLTTTDGTWTGTPTPTFTYQWQRTGSDIGGATSSTYVLVAADYANTIRCVVTATNAAGSAAANSNSTASVAGNAPVNTVAPVVSGTATFGQTLSTTDGTWTGVPTPSFTYQWQRTGSNIGGATSSTYVLVAADVGNTIRCVVTATNAAGLASANSNSTASVAATVPGAPTIGTATATGAITATVSYTAPASNGGATITSYTATSSPGGITGSLATAGSGTITVSGLNPVTSYTFTVTATNSAGTSAASAASNSITTPVAYYMAIITGGTDTVDSGQRNDLLVTSDNYVIIGGNTFVTPAITGSYTQGLLSISPTFTISQAKRYYTGTNSRAIVSFGMAYQASTQKLVVKVATSDAGNVSAFQTMNFSSASSLTFSSYSGATINVPGGVIGNANWAAGWGVAIDSSGGVYGSGASQYDTCCGAQFLPAVGKKNSSGTAVWGDVVPNGQAVPYFLRSVALDETNSYAWYSGYQTYGFVWRVSTSTGAMAGGVGKNFTYTSNVTMATGITLDSSQNVYLGYSANGPGALIKIDSSVAVQWQRRLTDSASSGDARWFAVKYSSFDGYIYAAGTLYSGSYDESVVIAKFDTSGNIQWQRRIVQTAGAFPFRGPPQGSILDTDTSGNIYVTANIRNSSTGAPGTFVAKLPADGSLTATGISVGVNTYTYEASTCSVSTTTTSTNNNNGSALVTMTNGSTTTDTVSTYTTNQTIATTII
jgi:hypothetical protein